MAGLRDAHHGHGQRIELEGDDGSQGDDRVGLHQDNRARRGADADQFRKHAGA